MALLTVQKLSKSGVVPSFAAATSGGDTFSNDGATTFRVKNGDSGSHTVTFHAQSPCSQGFTHDIAVTVGAGVEKDIGPFDPTHYNDGTQLVHVTYDAVTSVTVAAVDLG
jgi:hypothetical protein